MFHQSVKQGPHLSKCRTIMLYDISKISVDSALETRVSKTTDSSLSNQVLPMYLIAGLV
jgi:hypothetical protein